MNSATLPPTNARRANERSVLFDATSRSVDAIEQSQADYSLKASQVASNTSTPDDELPPKTAFHITPNDLPRPEKVHIANLPSSAHSRGNSAATTMVDLSLSNQVRSALGYPAKKQWSNSTAVTPSRTPLPEELEEGTDPLRWGLRYKSWVNTTYCILILSTTYGSSAFAPSVTQLVREWGIERHLALAGTSTYVLGFALGPFILAPCSEVFGRKPIYGG